MQPPALSDDAVSAVPPPGAAPVPAPAATMTLSGSGAALARQGLAGRMNLRVRAAPAGALRAELLRTPAWVGVVSLR